MTDEQKLRKEVEALKGELRRAQARNNDLLTQIQTERRYIEGYLDGLKYAFKSCLGGNNDD